MLKGLEIVRLPMWTQLVWFSDPFIKLTHQEVSGQMTNTLV